MYIAVYNDKGGSCKTTFVREIALYLERNKKKALVVDLDYKHNITKSFNIEKELSVSNILEGISAVEEVLEKTEYLDIVPGSYNLKNCEINKSIREATFNIEKDYDYIFFDTANENVVSDMAIYQSDIIIVPVVPEKYSVDNLEYTLTHIEKLKEHNQKVYVIVMKYDDSETSRDMLEDIYNICSEKSVNIFRTKIRIDETVKSVQLRGKELRSYDFVSDAAEDYKSLTEEFNERMEFYKMELKKLAEEKAVEEFKEEISKDNSEENIED